MKPCAGTVTDRAVFVRKRGIDEARGARQLRGLSCADMRHQARRSHVHVEMALPHLSI
ncbi:MAG: hypothetical protein AAGA74_09770 [Pseudomonadota bacterium]